MQNKSFIFWLLNSAKKVLYLDGIIKQSDTFLKPNGQPAHLQYSPDGWKGILVKYGRNMKYLGVFRDLTVPMNFKKDGAAIVKDAMWKQGAESVNYLAISKLNRTVYPPKYEPWYVGELDFSKFDQKKSNVTVNVMEGGMSKYLKAYESTAYEIPVDADPQAKIVVMDGLPFTNKIEYSIFKQGFSAVDKTYLIGMGTISQEGSTQGILNRDQFKEELNTTNGFMLDSSKYISVSVTGSISIERIISRPVKVYIRKTNIDTGVNTDYLVIDETPPSGSKTYSISFAIPMEPNVQLAFVSETTASLGTPQFIVTGGSMILNYEVTFDQTYIKGLLPIRLLQKLVEKMTEGKFTARSTYIEAMDDLLITSGSAIRNHEGQSTSVSGSVIKTSLADFFKAMNIRNIGLGIENDTLVIEEKKYFFKDDISVDLGEVNELEISIADDLIINTIKTGYPNQTYDEVNGKDEPNVTQNYTTPITRIVAELDITSPYRADAYGIELMRINLDGKDTTDNSADNDTFFLNVKKGGTYIYYSGNLSYNANGAGTITIPVEFLNGIDSITLAGTLNSGTFPVVNTSYLMAGNTILTITGTLTTGTENAVITATSDSLYMLNRPAFSSITGLLHPSRMFNVLLSPHRNVLNNGNYIHSVLDFQDPNFIKFQTGDKNSELSTTLSGITITEKADIQIADLSQKLFRPYYFSFTVPTDFNFLKTEAASPYSKLSFTYNKVRYYGYLIDGGVKPANRDTQTIKLLCAPETNLLNLINIP